MPREEAEEGRHREQSTAPNASFKPHLIDHSAQLYQHFAKFLYSETLSDLSLVVRKGSSAFDIHLDDADEESKGFDSSRFVKIPVHKVVLTARCPYFYAQFCKADWADKNQGESQLT
jgi:hypothetical protein